MLNDYNNRLTPTAQAFTSTGGVATNSQPLPATGIDPFIGEPLGIRFTLTVVSAASGTLQFQVVSATNADGTTGQVVLNTTAAITDTSLAAGDEIVVPCPPGLIEKIAATATHYTGKIVLASSGTCTAIIDVVPLLAYGKNQFATAEPTLQ
jgi:hypothetical protein